MLLSSYIVLGKSTNWWTCPEQCKKKVTSWYALIKEKVYLSYIQKSHLQVYRWLKTWKHYLFGI